MRPCLSGCVRAIAQPLRSYSCATTRQVYRVLYGLLADSPAGRGSGAGDRSGAAARTRPRRMLARCWWRVALSRSAQPRLQRAARRALASAPGSSGWSSRQRRFDPHDRVAARRGSRPRPGGAGAAARAPGPAAAAAAQRPGLRRDRGGARHGAWLGRDTARTRRARFSERLSGDRDHGEIRDWRLGLPSLTDLQSLCSHLPDKDTAMRCYDEGALRAYLDDALPAAERDSVAAHISGCPACRRLLGQLAHAGGAGRVAAGPSPRPRPTAGAGTVPRDTRHETREPSGVGRRSSVVGRQRQPATRNTQLIMEVYYAK